MFIRDLLVDGLGTLRVRLVVLSGHGLLTDLRLHIGLEDILIS